MNTYLSKQFPIFRDAEQLVIAIEQVVRIFSRYYKYTLGSELRILASKVLTNVTHAINQKSNRLKWVQNSVLLIEELKLKVQLGKSLKAFSSFAQFEHIAKLAVTVSKQSNAWLNKLQRYIHNRLKQRQLRELFIAL